MRRIASHKFTAALFCYGLVCSAGGWVAHAQPQASSPTNEETSAATLFELGVSLVEAKRFDEALGAFDLAYRLAPHPDVLFNLGLVQFELKKMRDARATLERYLEITPEEETSQRLQARRVLGLASLVIEKEASPAAAAPLPGRSEPVATSGPPYTQAAPQVVAPPRRASPAVPEAIVPPSRAAANVLIGTGTVLLLGGGSLWWWSSTEAAVAQQELAILERTPPAKEITSQLQLQQTLSYEQDRARLEATLERTATLDWLALALGAVGLMATGAGVYLGYWDEPQTAMVRLSPRELAWGMKW